MRDARYIEMLSDVRIIVSRLSHFRNVYIDTVVPSYHTYSYQLILAFSTHMDLVE